MTAIGLTPLPHGELDWFRLVARGSTPALTPDECWLKTGWQAT